MTDAKDQLVVVFGASGRVGRLLVPKLLNAGYQVRAFVRNASKYSLSHERLSVVEGQIDNESDVFRAMDGVNVAISCMGNTHGSKHLILDIGFANILDGARRQQHVPRCMFISSAGAGGTSWLIKMGLSCWLGFNYFDDLEKADLRVRETKDVPCVLVRPGGLTDDPALPYFVQTQQNIKGVRQIPRESVANFFMDMLTNTQYDGHRGVQLGSKKK